MRKHITKLLCLFVSALITLGMAACQTTQPMLSASAGSSDTGTQPAASGASNTEPITFTFYVGNYWQSNYIDPAWTDPVAKELTKRTGVTLDVSVPASDDDEGEMNKLIASDELADMIFRSGGAAKETLASGGYVKPLDDLIEQHGSNIKKNLGGSFPAWKNRTDGKIYNVGFWYFNKISRPALNLILTTLYMRYDILKEMSYDKLDRSVEGSLNSFLTLDEYYTLLEQVKAKYPDVIPALVQPQRALDILYRSTGEQVLNGYIWEDGKAKDYVFSSNESWALQQVNNFYQKGYAAIDNTTTTDEARTALMADEKVFSCMGYENLTSNVNNTMSKENKEKRYVMFYLRKDASVSNMYINHAWGDAYSGVHINAKLDDAKTIRAMQFLDYCASDEGSLLVCAGVEGTDYTKDDSTGWYKPNADVFAGYSQWDANVLKKTGVGGWLNILPNIAGVTADGHCYDINAEYAFSQDEWVIYNNADWKNYSDVWIVSPYTEFDTNTQTDAIDADSKISAYKNDRLANIVMLKDPSAIDGELAKLREQMKSDGYDAVETAMTDNWKMIAQQKERSPESLNQTTAQADAAQGK